LASGVKGTIVSFPQEEHFTANVFLGAVPLSVFPDPPAAKLLLLDVAFFLFVRHGRQRFGALTCPMDANCSCSFAVNVKAVPQS